MQFYLTMHPYSCKFHFSEAGSVHSYQFGIRQYQFFHSKGTHQYTQSQEKHHPLIRKAELSGLPEIHSYIQTADKHNPAGQLKFQSEDSTVHGQIVIFITRRTGYCPRNSLSISLISNRLMFSDISVTPFSKTYHRYSVM